MINTPSEYDACHLFPNAVRCGVNSYTPVNMSFADGQRIDWGIVNGRFKRFMIKDYVKSVKDTDFPLYFETPVRGRDMEKRIAGFIELRDKLFTGGIVLKEFVELKRYGTTTNEYRAFFLNNQLLSLSRNSNQSDNTPFVTFDFVKKFSNMPSKYYTVDFGEMDDGEWIVVETGDGQVSGLSPNQNMFKYFDDMRRILF